MFYGVFRQIAEEFAEGFRPMESMAADETFNLPQKLLPLGHTAPATAI